MTPLRRYARIDLPSLAPDQALNLVFFLEDAIAAIWEAHGPEMDAHDDWFEDDHSSDPIADQDEIP